MNNQNTLFAFTEKRNKRKVSTPLFFVPLLNPTGDSCFPSIPPAIQVSDYPRVKTCLRRVAPLIAPMDKSHNVIWRCLRQRTKPDQHSTLSQLHCQQPGQAENVQRILKKKRFDVYPIPLSLSFFLVLSVKFYSFLHFVFFTFTFYFLSSEIFPFLFNFFFLPLSKSLDCFTFIRFSFHPASFYASRSLSLYFQYFFLLYRSFIIFCSILRTLFSSDYFLFLFLYLFFLAKSYILFFI